MNRIRLYLKVNALSVLNFTSDEIRRDFLKFEFQRAKYSTGLAVLLKPAGEEQCKLALEVLVLVHVQEQIEKESVPFWWCSGKGICSLAAFLVQLQR